MTTTPTVYRAEQQANVTDASGGNDDQQEQQIVALSDGRIVVLWESNAVGGPPDIVARVFDGQGSAEPGTIQEFRANRFRVSENEGNFTAAARPDGTFVVAYEHTESNGTSIVFNVLRPTAVFFDNPVAGGFILADPGADILGDPTVTVAADGSFLVVYQRQAGGSVRVEAVKVSSTFVVGAPQIVLTASDQGFQTDVATLSDGRFVVVSRYGAADDAIDFRILNAAGTPQGAEFFVANTGGNGQTDSAPSVAALTSGGFVVTWQNFDGTDTDTLFQIYSSAGNQVGGLGLVNGGSGVDFNVTPEVVGLPDGGFVIVHANLSDSSIRLQRFDAGGAPVGTEVTVTTGPGQTDLNPTVTLTGDGRLLVGWTTGRDTGGGGVDRDVEFAILDPRPVVIEGNATGETINSGIGGTVNGNGGDDRLIGFGSNEVLNGGAGNDIIDGRFGFDTLDGGADIDTNDSSFFGGGYDWNMATGAVGFGGVASTETAINFENALTGAGADDIIGTDGANVITTQGGDDTIDGGDGDDTIRAGAGFDDTRGGAGNDVFLIAQDDFNFFGTERIDGGADFDTIRLLSSGIAGNPIVIATTDFTAQELIGIERLDFDNRTNAAVILAGNQIGGPGGITDVFGASGPMNRSLLINLFLDPDASVDLSGVNFSGFGDTGETLTIQGSFGDDVVIGSFLRDIISVGQGLDDVQAGFGDDLILVANNEIAAAGERIDGGDGFDTLGLRVGSVDDVDLSLANLVGLERLDLADRVATVSFSAGQIGGFDKVYEVVSAVGDRAQSLVVKAAPNADLTELFFTNWGTIGKTVTILGTSGNNTLTGSSQSDVIRAGAGNDRLDGGDFPDTLFGGAGNDTYVIDDAGTVIDEDETDDGDDGGLDTVLSSVDHVLSAFVENLTLTGFDSVNGTGNNLANRIIGNDSDNVLNGGFGFDDIRGGFGNDTIQLGAGQFVAGERMDGGGSFDTLALFGIDTTIDLSATPLISLEAVDFGIVNNLTLILAANQIGGPGDITEINSAGLANNQHLVVQAAPHANISSLFFDFDFDQPQKTITVLGTGALNSLVGSQLRDTLRGLGGNDTLDGGFRADTMFGGAGNDTYRIDEDGDVVDEDETNDGDDGGLDTVISSASAFTLPDFVENLTLMEFADNGTGNALANRITGNSNSNTLRGGGGADDLRGGRGFDSFVLFAGDLVAGERLDGGADRDAITLASANDTVELSSALLISIERVLFTQDGTTAVLKGSQIGGPGDIDTIDTFFDLTGARLVINADNNVDLSSVFFTLNSELEIAINGNGLVNTLVGSTLSDVIRAGAGSDRLDGRGSTDTMFGGAGSDTYIVDDAGDVIDEDETNDGDDGGIDTVEASASYVLSDFVETLTLTGTDAIAGTGNGLSNAITGNSAANTLNGGGGADTLTGAGGADLLDGQDGGDIYNADLTDIIIDTGATGTDRVVSVGGYTLAVGNGVEQLQVRAGTSPTNIILGGNELANTIIGNDGANTLRGAAGNDVLTGNGGIDRLQGGTERDLMTGGADADTFIFLTGDTFATAFGFDTITDFSTGVDKIDLSTVAGTLAVAAYAETTTTGTAFGDALSAANNAALDGTNSVVFVAAPNDGWVFWSTDGTNTTLEAAVRLNGRNSVLLFGSADVI